MSLLLNLRDFTLLEFPFCIFAVAPAVLPRSSTVCAVLLCDRLLWAFNVCIKMEFTVFFLFRPPFYVTIKLSSNDLINSNRAHDNSNDESENFISQKLKLCECPHLCNGILYEFFTFHCSWNGLGNSVWLHRHIVCVIKFNYIGAFVYSDVIGKYILQSK